MKSNHNFNNVSELGRLLMAILMITITNYCFAEATLQNQVKDSSELLAELERVQSLLRVDFNQAIELCENVRDNAHAQGYQDIEVRALYQLVGIKLIQANVSEADSLLSHAGSLVDSTQVTENRGQYLHLKGTIANMQGNYSHSLDSYKEAYEVFKKINSKQSSLKSIANIGAILMQQQLYEEAIENINEALELVDDNSHPHIKPSLLINLSIAQKNLHDTLSAFGSLLAAEPYIKNGNIHTQYAYHANLLDMYSKFGPPQKMKHHAESMLQISEVLGSEEKKAYSYLGLGQYHSHTGSPGLGEDYLKKSLDAYLKVEGDESRLMRIYAALSENAELQSKFEQAYLYQKKQFELKDKILDATNKEKILELEKEFKLEHEKSKTLAARLELSTTKSKLLRQRMIGLILLILAIGVITFILMNQRRKQQIHEESVKRLKVEQKNRLLLEHQKAEEEERGRISRQLHDSIGGLLVASKMHLAPVLDTSTGAKVNAIIDQAYHQTRTLSHNLNHINLTKSGLRKALKSYTDMISTNEVQVSFEMDESIQEIPSDYQNLLYSSAQELLTNALKHADANYISLSINQHDDGLEMTVSDDGKGLDQNHSSNGIGLEAISNQIHKLNGEFKIESFPMQGTKIQIQIPFSYV